MNEKYYCKLKVVEEKSMPRAGRGDEGVLRISSGGWRSWNLGVAVGTQLQWTPRCSICNRLS